MAENDDIKQMIRDISEQSRQQHDETRSLLTDLGKRVEANEQNTTDLARATRETFQAVDARMKNVEGRLDALSSGKPARPQLSSSTDKSAKKDEGTNFGEDFLTGFTGGIWQPKK